MSARSPESPGDEPTPAEHDEEARLFYERLEQRGQLVDVDANTDLSALPPHVTHIRHPDGTIERIGYAAF
jgi:hypothetical protein